MRVIAGISVSLALILAVLALAVSIGRGRPGPQQVESNGRMGTSGPSVPSVDGYVDGQAILFMHTEASDREVAAMLTAMMGGSPVLVVPTLALVPTESVGPVYVFQNGVAGHGPFGFQPDVFEGAPRSAGYTPLRKVHLVLWRDSAQVRELKSAAEIAEAQRQGLLTVERTNTVVNMPFLTWPEGRR